MTIPLGPPKDSETQGQWQFPRLKGIGKDPGKGCWWPVVRFNGVPEPDPFLAEPSPMNLEPEARTRREGLSRGQKACEKAWLQRLEGAQPFIHSQGSPEEPIFILLDPLDIAFSEAMGRGAFEDAIVAHQTNPAGARDLYEEGALFGHVECQFRYAAFCDEGLGGPLDQGRARRWYLEASEGGHLEAKNNLAWMLAHGEGGAKDLPEAIRLMTQAAESGYARAQSNLGAWLYHGDFLPKDLSSSREWHRKAAEQGYPHSQEEYGAMLYNGLGGPIDISEAMEWIRKAAVSGRPNACFGMFQFCLHGVGMAPDKDQAAEWFQKALTLGSPQARAWMMEQGLVP